MNADPEEARQWEAIVRCWHTVYTFSHDHDGHPDEPLAAHRMDGQGTLRAATPAALLDAIKDDAASRPFAPAAATGQATTEDPR